MGFFHATHIPIYHIHTCVCTYTLTDFCYVGYHVSVPQAMFILAQPAAPKVTKVQVKRGWGGGGGSA